MEGVDPGVVDIGRRGGVALGVRRPVPFLGVGIRLRAPGIKRAWQCYTRDVNIASKWQKIPLQHGLYIAFGTSKLTHLRINI